MHNLGCNYKCDCDMPTPTHKEPLKPESVEEIIKDFVEEFKIEAKEKYQGEEVLVYHGDCMGQTNDMISFIREAYTAGRSSIIKEINEKYEQ